MQERATVDHHYTPLSDAVRAMAQEEQLAVRSVMRLVLDELEVREELERRLGWDTHVRDRRYRTLMTLDWPDGPPEVRRAISVWDRLPARLDELITTFGWPPRHTLPAEVDAALWVLVLHSDRDPELRDRWLRAATELVADHGVDSYFLAVARDHAEAVASARQLYGTMTGPPEGTPLVPVHEPEGLERRRSEIGLPPLDDDLRRGVNYATVAARLAQLARL